jgi:chromosome segregation ATPase
MNKITFILGLIIVLALQGCDEAGSAAVEAKGKESTATEARLQSTINNLTAELNLANEQVEDLQAELANWPEFVDWDNQAYEVIDGRLALADESHLANQPDIQFILSEYVDLLGQRDSLNDQIAVLESDLAAAQADLDACLSDKDSLTTQLATANTDLATAQSDLATAQSDLVMAEDNLATAQADLATCMSENDTLTADLATAQADLATAQADLATAQSDLATAQADLVTCMSEKDSLTTQLATANADLATAQSDLATAQADLATCMSERDSLTTQLAAANAALAAVQADLITCMSEKVNLAAQLVTANNAINAAQADLATTQAELAAAMASWPTSKYSIVDSELVKGSSDVQITQATLDEMDDYILDRKVIIPNGTSISSFGDGVDIPFRINGSGQVKFDVQNINNWQVTGYSLMSKSEYEVLGEALADAAAIDADFFDN